MSARITNGMLITSYNKNLQTNMGKMQKLQQQLQTSKKNTRLSDDPVSVVKILNAKAKQNDVEQFKKNLRDATAWLTQTESALTEANSIVKRVYELAVYAANDSLSANERESIGEEVVQLRDQLVTLGNTTLGDKYIFGGYNVSNAPFYVDPEDDSGEITLNNVSMITDDGDNEFVSYEINFGIEFPVAISGSAFMGAGEEDNLYFQINAFYNTLMNHESLSTDITPFISKMQELQENILTQTSEVGGRVSRIEMMEERYEQDLINYTKMRSDVEDLDEAEGLMYFSMAEAVYRAALGIGGKILQPTLMDFLR